MLAGYVRSFDEHFDTTPKTSNIVFRHYRFVMSWRTLVRQLLLFIRWQYSV